jgi:hypothetical protein
MPNDKSTLITRETPANLVLNHMLGSSVRYPCLCSMAYQLAEQLEATNPDLANDCLDQVNEILSCHADPASVRRFAARHGKGWTLEARAFHAALIYLIDEDEGRREQYLDLSTAGRRDFVRCRLWRAGEMQVEQDVAL